MPGTTTRSSAALLVLALAACSEPASPAAPPPPAGSPVLEVDGEGIFTSTGPVEGAWFGGFGVRCLLPPLGRTDGHRLVGRIEEGDSPVLLRRLDGELDSLRPELRRVDGSLRTELRDAARTAFPDGLPGAAGSAFVDGLHAATAEPAPPVPQALPPRAAGDASAEAPAAEGAPLMAWAPDDALVVRFRSVEAAFRFADLADHLAGRLAAAEGEGGDHGTLRLTLHHLLLPSIWRANPGGRKGVAECALIVAAPYAVGRPRAAVVLRIVDPQLHDHETRAGIALESRPEHLWRPEGDPFPESRVRTAVRAVAGDCEVVATDRALLQRVLDGPGREPDEWSQDAVASRHGLPEPTRRRAFTLLQPEGAQILRSGVLSQEWQGARALAERWIGLHVPLPPADFGGPEPASSPWSHVVAMTADTDARGAALSVRLADAGAAAALGERLTALPRDSAVLQAACRDNLERLVPLGFVEPRASDVAERAFVWFGRRPVCPLGGAYRFHPATGAPSCSVHGDGAGAPPNAASSQPRVPLSDVAVDGTLVTFRLSIDW